MPDKCILVVRLSCVTVEYKLIRPIVNGYVEDYDAFEMYIKGVVKKLVRFPRLCLKTVIIAIPNDLVGDENASACDRFFSNPSERWA